MSLLKVEVTCAGSREVLLADLHEFQGELKSLSEEAYVKLRREILLHGITFPIAVWKSRGKLHIIDGHQRVRALRRMEAEGIYIPMVPVADVKAKDVKEAKQKVLAGASQFGEVERDGLYQFMHEAQIDFSTVNQLFQFPEIDLPSFHAEYFQETVAKEEDPRGEGSPPVPESSPQEAPTYPHSIHTEPTPEKDPPPERGPDEPVGNFRDREPDGKENVTYRFLPEEKQELMWKCDELMKEFKVLSHAEVIFALVADAHRKIKAKAEKK